jgi:hypothetical protein
MPRQFGPTIRTTFRTQLGKAGRDDECGLHATLDALRYRLGDSGGWRGDHRQVHGFRHFQKRRIAINPMHCFTLWIDGINHPAEGILQKVVHQNVADASRRGTCPHNSHRRRSKERIEQITTRHARSLLKNGLAVSRGSGYGFLFFQQGWLVRNDESPIPLTPSSTDERPGQSLEELAQPAFAISRRGDVLDRP